MFGCSPSAENAVWFLFFWCKNGLSFLTFQIADTWRFSFRNRNTWLSCNLFLLKNYFFDWLYFLPDFHLLCCLVSCSHGKKSYFSLSRTYFSIEVCVWIFFLVWRSLMCVATFAFNSRCRTTYVTELKWLHALAKTCMEWGSLVWRRSAR